MDGPSKVMPRTRKLDLQSQRHSAARRHGSRSMSESMTGPISEGVETGKSVYPKIGKQWVFP